ncbi:MAG: hypothetical protein HUU20_02895 [Pirellulales bacterium]|nr:hypothetical protein [Pirellulales bacterium]
MEVAAVLDAISGIRTVVVGEAMLDVYVEGAGRRLCQEAPVPVVAVARRAEGPGGAANVAANVAALGAHASCLSVVGDDSEGRLLRESLDRAGVETGHLVCEPGRRTLTKHRVVAAGQMLVRFDQGDVDPPRTDSQQALVERLNRAFAECELVIVSDYGYGILTPRVIAALAALQSQSPRFVVVDSKNLGAYRGVGVAAVKPNRFQAARLLGMNGDDAAAVNADTLLSREADLYGATGASIVAVTLDSDGAIVFQRGGSPCRTTARPSSGLRAIGAGDTYVAALGLALAAGADPSTASRIASAAAEVVTRKEGTAVCLREELCDELLPRRTLGSELIYVPKKPARDSDAGDCPTW